jgi:hypothetical protein
MSATNKISKELLNVLTFIKDSVKSDLTNSALKAEVALDQEKLLKLHSIVESSFERSTQKALVNFERNSKNIIAEATDLLVKRK